MVSFGRPGRPLKRCRIAFRTAFAYDVLAAGNHRSSDIRGEQVPARDPVASIYFQFQLKIILLDSL